MDRTSTRRHSEITGAADTAPGMTHRFHREHLFAAGVFVDSARRLEARGVTTVGTTGAARHRSFVMGAVFSSVAFLECSINELYLEVRDAGRGSRSGSPQHPHASLAQLWTAVEAQPVLLRYQMALQAVDAERFNVRRTPCRDVESLLQLRDALMHYEPEQQDARQRHHSLQRRLRGTFTLNTLLPERSLWFPDLCLGSGCAAWALRTAEVFSDDFCRRMSIASRGHASRATRPPRRGHGAPSTEPAVPGAPPTNGLTAHRTRPSRVP